MTRSFTLVAFTTAVCLAQPGAALAQAADAMTLGKEIYEDRCAVCHGAGGKGDGEVGAMFENVPGDLTKLQPENRFFPYMEVLAKIDGREIVMGHGTEMPIWGDYFMTEALEDRGVNENDAATIVNGRLAALLLYIATLQE